MAGHRGAGHVERPSPQSIEAPHDRRRSARGELLLTHAGRHQKPRLAAQIRREPAFLLLSQTSTLKPALSGPPSCACLARRIPHPQRCRTGTAVTRHLPDE